MIFLIEKTNWTAALSARPGPWDSGVLATFSIIAAGTGIGWINAGADYARYLPRRFRARSIVFWTTLGSTVPLFVLIMVGVLLSSRVGGLASSANPVQEIGDALPSWMAIPYLLTAIGGLVAAADLSIYSSGLNLLAMGLKVERYKTVLVDGVLMIAGSILVMLVSQTFFAPFESFLQLLADGLAAWGAIFLVDMLVRRGYDAQGLHGDRPDRSLLLHRRHSLAGLPGLDTRHPGGTGIHDLSLVYRSVRQRHFCRQQPGIYAGVRGGRIDLLAVARRGAPYAVLQTGSGYRPGRKPSFTP